MNLVEIENASGLYKVDKMKVMYLLGYGERIAYMVNLDTNKATWKEINNGRLRNK